MQYWIMKSEPDVFSFADLKNRPNQKEPWNGVRNYQARNFMRDDMRKDDIVLFYHSSCPVPGIAGLAKVASLAYPDETQFDAQSEYYDPKATVEKPRWYLVDVAFYRDISFISLEELKKHDELSQMRLLQKGNRLSILPVSHQEYQFISTLF